MNYKIQANKLVPRNGTYSLPKPPPDRVPAAIQQCLPTSFLHQEISCSVEWDLVCFHVITSNAILSPRLWFPSTHLYF